LSAPELRAQLRKDETAGNEDALINSLCLAAQGVVEKMTQRLLTRRSAVLRLTDLPSGKCPIELPGGEVASITSMTADAIAVTGTTFLGDSPALLLPAADWPTVAGDGYPVIITYQVGFATVPEDLKAAIKLLASEMFERRANGEPGTMTEVPVSAQFLMDNWRIRPAA
jgi:uncharacterized phiE125 gp8 family phage protein